MLLHLAAVQLHSTVKSLSSFCTRTKFFHECLGYLLGPFPQDSGAQREREHLKQFRSLLPLVSIVIDSAREERILLVLMFLHDSCPCPHAEL